MDTGLLQFAFDSLAFALAAFAIYHVNENTKECKRHVQEINRQYLDTIERLVESVVKKNESS